MTIREVPSVGTPDRKAQRAGSAPARPSVRIFRTADQKSFDSCADEFVGRCEWLAANVSGREIRDGLRVALDVEANFVVPICEAPNHIGGDNHGRESEHSD